jgi:hypothetical protein
MRTNPRTVTGVVISTGWRTSIVAIIGLLMTAVLLAMHVSVDSNQAAPWATYKTYAWMSGTPGPDPLNYQRLQASINERLAARGLTRNPEAPNLLVVTNVTTQQQQDLVPAGFGYGPWWGGGYYGGGYFDTWIEGTLVVDFYDAKTKLMVWRGVATDETSDKPTHNMEKMNKALDKMFEKLHLGVLESER